MASNSAGVNTGFEHKEAVCAWLHDRIELLDGLEAISTAQIIEDDCRYHAIESTGTERQRGHRRDHEPGVESSTQCPGGRPHGCPARRSPHRRFPIFRVPRESVPSARSRSLDRGAEQRVRRKVCPALIHRIRRWGVIPRGRHRGEDALPHSAITGDGVLRESPTRTTRQTKGLVARQRCRRVRSRRPSRIIDLCRGEEPRRIEVFIPKV
jgi:hypothetical protein